MAANMRRLVLLTGIVLAALPATRATAACHVATFEDTPYSAGEAADKVTITVSNNGGAGVGSVDYETKNGTAKAPKDYESRNGTLTFAPGTSELSFDVQIKDDDADEPNETFLVELSNPTGCFTSIPDEPAIVTIQDDDKPIAQPSPTPTPPPTPTKTPKPKPSTVSASPSPSPSPSSPSPTTSASPIAIGDTDDGGISGAAVGGIVGAVVVLGGAAAFWVRRKFLV